MLASFFGLLTVTWYKSELKRSLDTSAVSFTSWSAGEEFECGASIVLSILTIGEQQWSEFIIRKRQLSFLNRDQAVSSSLRWDSSERAHLKTDFLWDFSDEFIHLSKDDMEGRSDLSEVSRLKIVYGTITSA